MKDGDAILVTTFLRFYKEGFKPDRDLILALTADEEGGQSNGVDWLLTNHPELMKAAFAFNPDGGGVDLQMAKPSLPTWTQARSSMPTTSSRSPIPADTARCRCRITRSTTWPTRCSGLQNYQFPFELNAITRAYFEKLATLEPAQTAADIKAMLATSDPAAIARLSVSPEWNSVIHTTCVATRLQAGHANNALPQMAQANVNCRILPGHSREEVRQDLIRIFADAKVTVKYVDNGGGIHSGAPDSKGPPPVALQPEVMKPLEKLVAVYWPGTPVIPDMATGASDSIFTNAAGIPTYNWSAVELEVSDVRAHGKDERLPETSFYKGVQFWYDYLHMITKGD